MTVIYFESFKKTAAKLLTKSF